MSDRRPARRWSVFGVTADIADAQQDLLSVESRMTRHHTSALALVLSPRPARPLARAIVVVLVLALPVLLLTPWRQTAAGSGKVTAFVPGARSQSIDAPINGRVVAWRVNEGATVAPGDVIVELADLNPSFMDAMFSDKLAALRDATARAQAFAIEVASQRAGQAAQRREAAQAAVVNAQIELDTARIRERRARTLAGRGLAATRDLETAVLALRKAEAEKVRADTALASADQDVEAFRKEEQRTREAADAAVADVDLRAGNAEARRDASQIRARVAGTVVRASRVGSGETVKEGDRLAMVVPTTEDQAAEIWVDGLDAALVAPGAAVRLQFAGFPALQVSGWRNVAIGTFGGRVAVVDAAADATGRFRVLVIPDPDLPAWPASRYIRQGTDVTGWVMLRRVFVGYEIWRQLNGFPPLMPVVSGKVGKGK